MKAPSIPFPKAASLAALAVSSLLLTNCVSYSTVESRIDAQPNLYIDLPPDQRQSVDRGQIKEGMSKDAVFLAWGNPDGVRESSSGGKRTETWLYESSRPVYTDSVSIGYGYGGYGYRRRGGYYDCYPAVGIGTDVSYQPYVSRTVEFRNDKVISWERLR